jgi:GNAT superfamily N-acetyltransferase
MEWKRDGYLITDELDRVNLDAIHGWLSDSYWAKGRPREVMVQAIPNSLCFSLYSGDRQIGFARAVTDKATFSWICDVIIDPAFRGQGLGKWLMACVTGHPDIENTKQILKTRDAHRLYEKYGFRQDHCMQKNGTRQRE